MKPAPTRFTTHAGSLPRGRICSRFHTSCSIDCLQTKDMGAEKVAAQLWDAGASRHEGSVRRLRMFVS